MDTPTIDSILQNLDIEPVNCGATTGSTCGRIPLISATGSTTMGKKVATAVADLYAPADQYHQLGIDLPLAQGIVFDIKGESS